LSKYNGLVFYESAIVIIGLGTQILDCPRVRNLIDRHGERFLYQVFSDEEIRFCNARTHATEFFAALWATKEAVFRCLGTKWKRGMDWHDVTVACDSTVEPRVTLHGSLKALADAKGASGIKATFAYSRMFATATAIAVSAI
jgi:holo-[acyl-carrier protein] synthase